MDRVGAGDLRGGDDAGDPQVGQPAGGGADADVVVGEADVERLPVRLAVHRHRLDAQLAARPYHPEGDLAAIGDQDLLEHQGVRSSDCATPGSPVISANFRSEAESTPDTRSANSFGLDE